MAKEKYQQRSKATNYLRAIVLAAGGFYYGYFVAAMNALSQPLFIDVLNYDSVRDEQIIQTLNGLVNLLFAAGALVGTLFTGDLAKIFGRRAVLYFGDGLALINLIPSLIPTTGTLLVSRTISGLASGIIVPIYSIYLVELLPNKLCGFGGSMGNLFIAIGVLFSYVNQNVATYGQLVKYWQIFFAYPLIVNVVRLIAYFFLFKTETPRCAFEKTIKESRKNKVVPATIEVVNSKKEDPVELSPPLVTEILETETDQIKEEDKPTSSMDLTAIRAAYSYIYRSDDLEAVVKENSDFWLKEKAEGRGSPRMYQLFGRKFRRQLFSGCFVALTFQLSGTNFIMLYSTLLFDSIVPNSGKLITLISGLSNLGGGIVGIFTIEKMGRKPNIVLGTVFQGLGMLLLAIGFVQTSLGLFIAGTIVFIAGFSYGVAGAYSTYISEVLPPNGMSLAFSVQWVFSMVISIIIPFVLARIGPLALMIFFLLYNVLATIVNFLTCVETKSKSSQEVNLEFGQSWIHVCKPKSK